MAAASLPSGARSPQPLAAPLHVPTVQASIANARPNSVPILQRSAEPVYGAAPDQRHRVVIGGNAVVQAAAPHYAGQVLLPLQLPRQRLPAFATPAHPILDPARHVITRPPTLPVPTAVHSGVSALSSSAAAATTAISSPVPSMAVQSAMPQSEVVSSSSNGSGGLSGQGTSSSSTHSFIPHPSRSSRNVGASAAGAQDLAVQGSGVTLLKGDEATSEFSSFYSFIPHPDFSGGQMPSLGTTTGAITPQQSGAGVTKSQGSYMAMPGRIISSPGAAGVPSGTTSGAVPVAPTPAAPAATDMTEPATADSGRASSDASRASSSQKEKASKRGRRCCHRGPC
eukprot:TRINITY_DN92698_c0_g1_i1.p1 TRINITY_DN92698_c0_g1~~TRINITY_DN92698_c0_g1_i1.p1  ORF type:complete len:340 (-),score=34.29 TRINITY_DN92698_c0_g1_i1:75-1094(-)